jgi:hypothetical protein
MLRRLVLATVVGSAVVLPTAADAFRPASGAEKVAIARSAKVPAACISAVVAEDTPGWASWNFRARLTARCRRVVAEPGRVAEASVFARKSGARWARRGSTADCGKPTKVPSSVWRELAPACVAFDEDGTPVE